MHIKPMDDSEGEFHRAGEKKHKCLKCGEVEVVCNIWESNCGGYEDYKYTCQSCKYYWWVDGPDS